MVKNFDQGCVTDINTLLAIGKWKSYARTNHLLKKNTDEKIRSVSSQAFGMIRGDDLIRRSKNAMTGS